MTAEECSRCRESRSPAIEHHDDERGRFVLCWLCDEEVGGVGL